MTTLITIQGQASQADSSTPLPGVKVIARQEGTEIQQETDSEGKFSLNLVPGLWRISARARGFNEPEAYMYNFSADTTGIDFRLEEGYSISGLVIKQEDGKPSAGAIVEVEAVIGGKTAIRRELTDGNGRFSFTGLPPGRWQVRGASAESQTAREMLAVGPDASNVNLTLARQMTAGDWRSGLIFFAALGLLLAVLAGVYLWAHRRFLPPKEPELAALTIQVEQARQIAAANTAAAQAAGPAQQTLRSSVVGLKENWNSVSGEILSFSDGQNAQVNALISRAETAALADNPQEVELALANLEPIFENPPSLYFWSLPPANYVEVLFWSLAGIFVSLLVTSGYYLRRQRFYAEGIWMHVSQLLAVPLLALVVVFLISQVKLSAQIGQSELALNISDPRLLAALSFIIAARPWAMVDFVRETAGSFFGQIQRRVAGGSEAQPQAGNIPS